MKPSERIKEIQEKHDLVNWNPRMPAWEAIIQYLDEQYGQQKPCEQYKCPSWFDDNNILRDCSCGKC